MKTSTALLVGVLSTLGVALAAAAMTASASSSAAATEMVLISELSPGPVGCWIEIVNPGTTSVPLNDLVVETTTGIFPLALTTTAGDLAPGEYFLLARSVPNHPTGVVDEKEARVVIDPLLHPISDTALLKRVSTATVLDAVAFGIPGNNPTGSAVYGQAVTAGQFAQGEYISIANRYTDVSLGRDMSNTDTNNLSSDWAWHGGTDAFCGSPGDANTAVLGGEDFSVHWANERINQLFLDVFDCSVVSASHSGYTGTDSQSSASYVFVLDHPVYGAITLTGSLAYSFVGGASGSNTVQVTGTLVNAGEAFRLQFECVEATFETSGTLAIDAVWREAGVDYPYYEYTEIADTGLRGDFTRSFSRSVTGWDSTVRQTESEQTVAWTVTAAELSQIDSSVDIVRDYHPYPRPPWWGAPNPDLLTQEHRQFDYSCTRNASGEYTLQFSNYTADYGSLGMARYSNGQIQATSIAGGDQWLVAAQWDIDYPYVNAQSPGAHTEVRLETQLTWKQNGDLRSHHRFLDEGVEIGQRDSYVDPALQIIHPGQILVKIQNFRNSLRRAAKKARQYAAVSAAGGGCAVLTSAASGCLMTFAAGSVCAAAVAGVYELTAP